MLRIYVKYFLIKTFQYFPLLEPDYESLRKAVVTQNINDIFKFVKGKEDLRKIADGNEHSHLEYLTMKQQMILRK